MITIIENAKSSFSKCKCCKQLIDENKIRGVEEINIFGHRGYNYYCLSCTLSILRQYIKNSNKLIEEIEKYVKNKS
jgi:hypothetical protein